MSATAVLGIDFLGGNGSIGFSPGITSSNIAISILPSNSRKADSRFTVVLHDPIGDVLLVPPRNTTVIITANDDYRGVLSWKPLLPNQSYPLTTVKRENDVHINLTVVRIGGTYGIVSVQWMLTLNGSSDVNSVISDLRPQMGLLVIGDGVQEKDVVMYVFDNGQPMPAALYRVDLLANTVTGGARVGDISSTYLIVEDGHAAYGIVEFANASMQKIVLVSFKLNFTLKLFHGIINSPISRQILYRGLSTHCLALGIHVCPHI